MQQPQRTVLVVEEKSAFVETAVRDALYGLPDAPAVIGSTDAAGAPLVPDKPVLDAMGDRLLRVGRGVSRFPAEYAEECRVAQHP